MESFVAADGRTVAFSRYGPEDGHRVLMHYGTPGTRLLGPKLTDAFERNKVSAVVLDRPGYGPSTRWPGRRIVDVVTDVVALTDQLGWDHFAVWGGSGGGPHALACAAKLADRVSRCAAVVCPAPYDADGLDWLEGMSPGNVEEFNLALQGEEAYRPLVERLAREAVEAVEAGQIGIPDNYELPDADVAALQARLSEPGYLERTIAAHAGGVDGWIDDSMAMAIPWGFDVAEIKIPVSIWYGPQDVLVPASHAEWLLAHVPGAERHELPACHILEDDELDGIHQWLIR